jgi:MazG family protein
VFGDADPGSVPGILAQWDRIKRDEKGSDVPRSALDGVPGSLPPLERAAALQHRAAKVGFDWPATGPVWEKLSEEIVELSEAADSGDEGRIEDELGDLLFTVVNLARFLSVDPGLALNRSNGKFARRFREIERRLAARGIAPAEAGLEAMDAIWNQLRDEERNASK